MGIFGIRVDPAAGQQSFRCPMVPMMMSEMEFGLKDLTPGPPGLIGLVLLLQLLFYPRFRD